MGYVDWYCTLHDDYYLEWLAKYANEYMNELGTRDTFKALMAASAPNKDPSTFDIAHNTLHSCPGSGESTCSDSSDGIEALSPIDLAVAACACSAGDQDATGQLPEACCRALKSSASLCTRCCGRGTFTDHDPSSHEYYSALATASNGGDFCAAFDDSLFFQGGDSATAGGWYPGTGESLSAAGSGAGSVKEFCQEYNSASREGCVMYDFSGEALRQYRAHAEFLMGPTMGEHGHHLRLNAIMETEKNVPINPTCEETCVDAMDGYCDDGGLGDEYHICDYGTDCTDCGERASTVLEELDRDATTDSVYLNLQGGYVEGGRQVSWVDAVGETTPSGGSWMMLYQPGSDPAFEFDDKMALCEWANDDYAGERDPVTGRGPNGECTYASAPDGECAVLARCLCSSGERVYAHEYTFGDIQRKNVGGGIRALTDELMSTYRSWMPDECYWDVNPKGCCSDPHIKLEREGLELSFPPALGPNSMATDPATGEVNMSFNTNLLKNGMFAGFTGNAYMSMCGTPMVFSDIVTDCHASGWQEDETIPTDPGYTAKWHFDDDGNTNDDDDHHHDDDDDDDDEHDDHGDHSHSYAGNRRRKLTTSQRRVQNRRRAQNSVVPGHDDDDDDGCARQGDTPGHDRIKWWGFPFCEMKEALGATQQFCAGDYTCWACDSEYTDCNHACQDRTDSEFPFLGADDAGNPLCHFEPEAAMLWVQYYSTHLHYTDRWSLSEVCLYALAGDDPDVLCGAHYYEGPIEYPGQYWQRSETIMDVSSELGAPWSRPDWWVEYLAPYFNPVAPDTPQAPNHNPGPTYAADGSNPNRRRELDEHSRGAAAAPSKAADKDARKFELLLSPNTRDKARTESFAVKLAFSMGDKVLFETDTRHVKADLVSSSGATLLVDEVPCAHKVEATVKPCSIAQKTGKLTCDFTPRVQTIELPPCENLVKHIQRVSKGAPAAEQRTGTAAANAPAAVAKSEQEPAATSFRAYGPAPPLTTEAGGSASAASAPKEAAAAGAAAGWTEQPLVFEATLAVFGVALLGACVVGYLLGVQVVGSAHAEKRTRAMMTEGP
jgi:hypothetical protein